MDSTSTDALDNQALTGPAKKGRPNLSLVWPISQKFTIKEIVAAQVGLSAGTINGKIAKAVRSGVIVKVGSQKLTSGKGRPYTVFSVSAA